MTTLDPAALDTLQGRGFVVLDGPFPDRQFAAVAARYDAEVSSAVGGDARTGSTSARVTDFVNRGPEFDPLYVYPPLLEAAASIVGPSFKLSSLNARTLRPGAAVLDIHVDVSRDSADWPLLGFILMIDAFTPDNGATRFIPGSHHGDDPPTDGHLQDYASRLVSACGLAGSLLVFNGSTWHGQGVNTSGCPRRSLQGAFIPRTGRAGTDFAERMSPDTAGRLTAVARHVLSLPSPADRAAAGRPTGGLAAARLDGVDSGDG